MLQKHKPKCLPFIQLYKIKQNHKKLNGKTTVFLFIKYKTTFQPEIINKTNCWSKLFMDQGEMWIISH